VVGRSDHAFALGHVSAEQSGALYDDDDVYLECYSGKGFHINCSVYMSYVKHINSSNKALVMNTKNESIYATT
jgi:hypothetical protein